MPTSEPLLTGSGTLFATIAFHPWLLAKSVEMAARYGPPLALYGRARRRDRRAHAAASGPASGPGSTIAVRPPPVPATRDAAAAK